MTSTNGHGPRRLGRVAVGAFAPLTMLLIGTALAAIPSTTAYRFLSHPMISGTVVSVNDRQMVVDTEQGEQVTLQMDTRTMAPRDLAPGMVMRAEFVALDDCRFYAQRIIPIRDGMSTERFQAYANTRDSRDALAASADAGGYHSEDDASVASARSRASYRVGEYSPGQSVAAIPSTADHHFSTRPMVTGEVISVNDHRLVVVTDQGQKVPMVMDSRTMVPAQVAPGTVFRAEFTQLDDGRYYAKRIFPIHGGLADREQAYAHTRDSDILLAENIPDCGPVRASSDATVTSVVETHGEVVTEPVVAQNVSDPAQEEYVQEESARDEVGTLPQTASNRPLLLLFGLLALGGGGIIMAVRGNRMV